MTEEETPQEIVNILNQRGSFNLKMTSKGVYYWDIKVYSDDIEEIKAKTVAIDEFAKQQWGSNFDDA